MSDYQAMEESNYPPIYERNYSFNMDQSSSFPGDYGPINPLDPNEGWFRKYWRPAIAWQYFFVCLFDFIIAPSVVIFFYYTTGGEYQQWQPLTLMASGFYHIAMGAIVGIATYGRTKEKMVGVDSE